MKIKSDFKNISVCRYGFTLIELLISIVISILLIGGGIVSINRFSSTQKLDSAKDELISDLRLARNYAITGQRPFGYTDNLAYVGVNITTKGRMKIFANSDVGSTYFSKLISPSGIGVSMTTSILAFSAYDGKLVKDDGINIVPVGFGETTTFIISSTEGIGDTKLVWVRISGLISEK
jgi:type II secretory pathway pseudopilin PulG